MKCNKKTEVYSRIVGYFRPVQNWNKGKSQEFKDRKVFSESVAVGTIPKNSINSSINKGDVVSDSDSNTESMSCSAGSVGCNAGSVECSSGMFDDSVNSSGLEDSSVFHESSGPLLERKYI